MQINENELSSSVLYNDYPAVTSLSIHYTKRFTYKLILMVFVRMVIIFIQSSHDEFICEYQKHMKWLSFYC